MRFVSVLTCIGILGTHSAFAQQRVVVLEIEGDQNNKLRNQIENSLVKAGAVEVVSLDEFRAVASKKKLNGAAAMTVLAVKRVGKQLKLDAAVSGEVGEKFSVVIWDRAGDELWTKQLSLGKKGTLSSDYAQKLSRAIAAAAEQGAARNSARAGGDGATESEGSPPSASTDGEGSSEKGAGPEIDLTGGGSDSTSSKGTGARSVVSPGSSNSASSSGSSAETRDSDLDIEGERTVKTKRPVPPILSFSFSGTTTWRAQCLRPGGLMLTSCAEFDRLPEARQPVGTTVTFTPQVPYFGLSANAELFPLARLDVPVINGFGLVGHLVWGTSLTKISEVNQQGMSEEKNVASTDLGWSVQGTWRFHFVMGAGQPQGIGYAGIRGGLQARSFLIDPNADVPLPSSRRLFPTSIGFPVIGADVAIPIVRQFRPEVGFSYFVNPRPAEDEIRGFGNPADDTGGAISSGFGIDVGGSGELLTMGPATLGWVVKARILSFFDRYLGQGQKWTVCNDTQCGGLGEETFVTINWGLTLSL